MPYISDSPYRNDEYIRNQPTAHHSAPTPIPYRRLRSTSMTKGPLPHITVVPKPHRTATVRERKKRIRPSLDLARAHADQLLGMFERFGSQLLSRDHAP